MGEAKLVLRARRVLLEDAEGHLRIEPAIIELRGLRIHAVHTDEATLLRAKPTHDFGDRLIAPAFVDAHTHLALSFLRGADAGEAASGRMVEDLFYRMETRLRPEDVRAFTRMGAYESLLSGVGLVYDHYYHAEAVAEALEEVGLSAVVAPTLQDLSGPGLGQLEAQLDATRSIASSKRLRQRGIFAAVGPHASDTVSAALWQRASELARELEIPLHAHIAQSPQEWSAVVEREGVPPLALLQRLGVLDEAPSSLLAHGLYATRAELESIPRDRVSFAFCPHSQLVFGFPAPVMRWAEMGLSFVVATDCGASNDSLSLQKELRFVAGARSTGISATTEYGTYFEGGAFADPSPVAEARRRAMASAKEQWSTGAVLRRGLSGPGSLHPGFAVGRIEPKALANLIVLDVDHPSLWPGRDLIRALVYSDIAPALHAMFVAGRLVGTPGHFHESVLTSEAYQASKQEADARLYELLGR